MIQRAVVLSACVLLYAVGAREARGATARIVADRDNTLYEDAAGSLSNGSGQYMFSGLTLEPFLRRALMRFDVAGPGGVPAGATITGATITLTQSRGGSSPYAMTLHRVLADWGEGASDALLEEGTGAAAQLGDATWLFRSFSGVSWANPGGDFDATVSSSTPVGGIGEYTWPSTSRLVMDVQQMLNQPAANFGWELIGEELTAPPTAKRFNTRENPDSATWPTLTVTYEVPGPGVGLAMWCGAVGMGMRRRRVAAV